MREFPSCSPKSQGIQSLPSPASPAAVGSPPWSPVRAGLPEQEARASEVATPLDRLRSFLEAEERLPSLGAAEGTEEAQLAHWLRDELLLIRGVEAPEGGTAAGVSTGRQGGLRALTSQLERVLQRGCPQGEQEAPLQLVEEEVEGAGQASPQALAGSYVKVSSPSSPAAAASPAPAGGGSSAEISPPPTPASSPHKKGPGCKKRRQRGGPVAASHCALCKLVHRVRSLWSRWWQAGAGFTAGLVVGSLLTACTILGPSPGDRPALTSGAAADADLDAGGPSSAGLHGGGPEEAPIAGFATCIPLQGAKEGRRETGSSTA